MTSSMLDVIIQDMMGLPKNDKGQCVLNLVSPNKFHQTLESLIILILGRFLSWLCGPILNYIYIFFL